MPPSEDQGNTSSEVPLFVDLDGTLVRTDTSVEASFRLVRKNLAYALRLPFWLLRGRAYLKRQVSQRVVLEPERLPYKPEFLAFLRAEHKKGRRIILATAADESYAKAVADYLDCLDGAFGSDGVTDLAGARKLDRIREETNGGPFDYAGDDLEDLAIFPHARQAIIAHPLPPVRLAAQRLPNVERVFIEEPRRLIDNFFALRPKRFVWNLLILLPLLLSGTASANLWLDGLIAFLCYCVGAASIYIYGDLLHMADLRRLPAGQRGAIADGRVAIQRAAQGIPLLAALAMGLAALWLPATFVAVLAAIYIVAFLAIQDWFPLPRLLVFIVLGMLRILAGFALLPGLPALWITVVSLIAGAASGIAVVWLNRKRIGYV